MERDNFFIILDLSVDPPQMDPQKIEEAIKKKQTDWSRLRNHPTKGIQAQKYIGMIPDIRKVMMNSELREKEAKSALEIIRKKKESQFSDIDRHLELLMSKGFIKEEEIFKLAKHHKININEIRNRIKLKEEEKFSALDQQIQIRSQKGFITESEIEALSIIHGMDKKSIRKRITCPIKKEKISRLQKTKPLDPSITGIIEENLKIIGKASLYEFLEISPDSEIEVLQQKAKEKEAEVLKIRKKDAIATASGVLVGHCISLFKNERNKASYDTTRIQAQLSQLNMDINVAGIEGVIRADNFAYLINRAIEFGMNPKEASSYIKNYCKGKNWEIETSSKKNIRTKGFFAKIFIIILILSAGAYYGFYLFNQDKLKKEYENLIAVVENQENLENKVKILKNFMSSHPEHKYSEEIQKQYKAYEKQLHFQHFDAVVKSADQLIKQDKFDEAMEIYKQYAKQQPQSPYLTDISKKREQLSELMEEKDYTNLKGIAKHSAEEKITAYRKFLQKYPQGKHYQSVISLLSDLSDVYYITLKDELGRCESDNTWETCIRLANNFINTYPDDTRSNELKLLRETYQKKYREEMVFKELQNRAGEKETDYESAKRIYTSYLNLNPTSVLKGKIQEEIIQLEQAQKEANLREKLKNITDQIKQANGRFVVPSEQIVLDKHTNLMWTLWDSNDVETGCLDYESAHQYVSGLRTGGYKDWRIPTPQELIKLYRTEPLFPLRNSTWYWTSISYKGYSDGWVQMVDVITTDQTTGNQKERIDSRGCGNVRAVRP